MTNEKAKEFFSAYYEETLEAGLRLSFEQKLKADRSLKEEYDSFVRAMDSLGVLKFEEIEIPHDLHEQISARLDRHLYEKKQSAKPAWNTWFRSLAFAGIGAVAIIGAMLALTNRGGGVAGDPATSSFGSSTKEQIKYSIKNDGVTLSFAPNSPKTVIITNGGKEVTHTIVGDGKMPALSTLLSNSLPSASVFGIQISGEKGTTYVVIPGTARSSVSKGEGTVVDFAKAASDFYRMPIRVSTVVPNERIVWAFTSPNAVAESGKALGSNYSVTLLDSGMLEVEQRP